jgi:hypothetical protein
VGREAGRASCGSLQRPTESPQLRALPMIPTGSPHTKRNSAAHLWTRGGHAPGDASRSPLGYSSQRSARSGLPWRPRVRPPRRCGTIPRRSSGSPPHTCYPTPSGPGGNRSAGRTSSGGWYGCWPVQRLLRQQPIPGPAAVLQVVGRGGGAATRSAPHLACWRSRRHVPLVTTPARAGLAVPLPAHLRPVRGTARRRPIRPRPGNHAGWGMIRM